MFKAVGKLLPEALGRLKVRRPVEASVICRACDEALGSLWDHAVPMRAASFRAGTVTVAVISPAWGHEVRSHGEELKARVNKKLGGAPVKAIKARVSPREAEGPSA